MSGLDGLRAIHHQYNREKYLLIGATSDSFVIEEDFDEPGV
jgi:hypothetical protein